MNRAKRIIKIKLILQQLGFSAQEISTINFNELQLENVWLVEHFAKQVQNGTFCIDRAREMYLDLNINGKYILKGKQ